MIVCVPVLHRPFCAWDGCCVCWENEDKARTLLCDGCNCEYHTYCLDPPLHSVPDTAWFCPRCTRLGKGIAGPAAGAHTDGLAPNANGLAIAVVPAADIEFSASHAQDGRAFLRAARLLALRDYWCCWQRMTCAWPSHNNFREKVSPRLL